MQKISFISLLFYILIYTPNSFSQEIDPEILKKLSPEEIEKISKDFLKKDLPTEIGDIKTEEPKESIKAKEFVESATASQDKQKFGYNYFSTVPTSVAAVGDLPLPNEYRVSLKDKLTVILSGTKQSIFDLDVQLDGTILFPELGSVYVVGETFQAVKDKLKRLIQQSYIGVEIDISLKNLSAKKITIVGAVNTPGTYLVNPFSTISSALAYSGGITSVGTLRKIKLIKNSGEEIIFDLYELLINGNRENDVTIDSGDVILVQAASNFVEIIGEVNRPGIYEIVEGETYEDLIKYSLGYTSMANKENLNLTYRDNTNLTIKEKNIYDLDKKIINAISIKISQYNFDELGSVTVRGAIKRPGNYSLELNPNLKTLVEKLEFVDTYPWFGLLRQFEKDELINRTIFFSLADKTTLENIKLKENAQVTFFRNKDFSNLNYDEFEDIFDKSEFNISKNTLNRIKEYSIKINHDNSEYLLPVYGQFEVKDLINFLGLDMSSSSSLVSLISPLDEQIIFNNFNQISFTANKYMSLTIRSIENDLVNVKISGAVEYPGTYTLEPNTSLQDLYNLIGKFKNYAFNEGIILTRESIRNQQIENYNNARKTLVEQSITGDSKKLDILENYIEIFDKEIDEQYLGRVAGDLSPNSETSLSTILIEGDEIYIPTKTYTINVTGQVLNPSNFQFKSGLTVAEAIQNAGGFTAIADKSKLYVIKANGMIVKPPKNIFIASNKILEPGDSVIVPLKIPTDQPVLNTIIPVTQILSNLAFAASALDNLKDW